jgi:hypothetical protein
MRVRAFRRLWHLIERTIPFVKALFSEAGLGSPEGRTLILGKARRVALSTVPPLARAMQKHYGLKGGCANCGTSCQLLFKCPHWDSRSRLCSVYEDRPNICRLFPITPGDIRDRDIAAKKATPACGFHFQPKRLPADGDLVPAPAAIQKTPRGRLDP